MSGGYIEVCFNARTHSYEIKTTCIPLKDIQKHKVRYPITPREIRVRNCD